MHVMAAVVSLWSVVLLQIAGITQVIYDLTFYMNHFNFMIFYTFLLGSHCINLSSPEVVSILTHVMFTLSHVLYKLFCSH